MSIKNILLVEDEVLIRILVKKILTKIGDINIYEAGAGQEALNITMNNEIDLILMDIKIKGNWDGIQTSIEINKTKNVNVIFMSAYDYENKINNLNLPYSLGFISKPVEENKISKILTANNLL